jgi:membrane fusion protein, multidrug efflux system
VSTPTPGGPPAAQAADTTNTADTAKSPAPAQGQARMLYVTGATLLIAAIALTAFLTVARRGSLEAETKVRTAAVDSGPAVRLAAVASGAGDRRITLTGESRPYFAVTLYSKVSGYLKEVRVDKGDKVHKGDILAVVESPETDEAYASSIADAKNKRAIADREAQLIARKLIAPEEAETAESQAEQAEAHASALKTIKGYEMLAAPFDGVVTARFADPGALMQNAQNAQTSSLPVLAIGTTDSLRVYVYVDQADASDVKRGSPATIMDPSRPNRPLTGVVARFTGELDPQTRTLLAEIDVPNHDASLVAGSILQVTLQVHSPPYLHVPAAAVFTQGTKNYVATVTADNRVAVREVNVVTNDGEVVYFTSDALKAGDRVALDLGNSVPDGQRIRIADDGAKHPAG